MKYITSETWNCLPEKDRKSIIMHYQFLGLKFLRGWAELPRDRVLIIDDEFVFSNPSEKFFKEAYGAQELTVSVLMKIISLSMD